jgi:Flp pilus assembly protein TadD
MSKRLTSIGVVLAAVAIAAGALWLQRSRAASSGFATLVNRGNAMLEKGDADGAIGLYEQALRLSPESTDVRLNLANAYLAAGRPDDAARLCQQALELSPSSAAAYYLRGCALLRENQPELASESFQQSWKIEPAVPALDFQTGMAQEALGQVPDAIRDFEGVIRAAPDHPSAHYQLSRLYRQAGRDADAERELKEHQRILAKRDGSPVTAAELERCKYTQPLAPFVLAQPDPRGIPVRFAEDTAAAFGALAARCRGPLAVIDYEHDGRQSLFARDGREGFLLLDNRAGRFSALGRPLPAPAAGGYRACLTGDLDNDGFDDVVVLGDQDSRVFKFYAHGRIRDATRAAGLEGLKATSGLLADLDFTGNLDLVAVQPAGAGLAVYRNLGNLYFDGTSSDSGLPRQLPGAAQVTAQDWDNEGLPGVFIARADGPPAFYAKRRAGAFAPGALTAGWPAGAVMATGDLRNDLHAQAVIDRDRARDRRRQGRPAPEPAPARLPGRGPAARGFRQRRLARHHRLRRRRRARLAQRGARGVPRRDGGARPGQGGAGRGHGRRRLRRRRLH